MKIAVWNIEKLTGYKPISTFYEDFSIADHFGKAAVQDTYNRAFESWKDNYKYLTELVLVLNWKIHEHYETNQPLGELYDDLWRQADEWAMENLSGDERAYFYEVTD
jgi:hypothetical protein